MREAWLIARTVLIEAVRRREVYAIVLAATSLIGAVMTVDFFEVQGLVKFYREVALQIMGVAASLTVIVLSARQLPREFEARTIYPLLAKPVGRASFLAGKLLGVMLAAAFCFGLFMAIYLAGSAYLRQPVPAALFAQHVYLQMLGMLVLATMCFWLSMQFNLDAAISIGVIFFLSSSTITTAISFLYDYTEGPSKSALVALNFLIPQLTLFDLSEKCVHSAQWPPLGAATIAKLTAYGGAFASVYFGAAMLSFRRRAL